MAAEGADVEAMILTRSLLSMTLRAVYVDEPTEPDERRRRFLQYQAMHLQDLERTAAGHEELGLEHGVEMDVVAEAITEIKSAKIGGFPNDTELCRILKLEPFYFRVFRPGSDAAHFSLGIALDELLEAESVELEQGNLEVADEVLGLAVHVYGLLLHSSERFLGHELGQEAKRLVDEWYGDEPPTERGEMAERQDPPHE